MNFLTHIKNKKSIAIIDENKNFIKSDELQKVVKFNSIIISNCSSNCRLCAYSYT